ncbi:MAG: hypothetical protein ACREYB_05675 [Casimicrobiaceae bacterium]
MRALAGSAADAAAVQRAPEAAAAYFEAVGGGCPALAEAQLAEPMRIPVAVLEKSAARTGA